MIHWRPAVDNQPYPTVFVTSDVCMIETVCVHVYMRVLIHLPSAVVIILIVTTSEKTRI